MTGSYQLAISINNQLDAFVYYEPTVYITIINVIYFCVTDYTEVPDVPALDKMPRVTWVLKVDRVQDVDI